MFERRLSDIFRFSHMEQPVSLKLKYTVDDPIRVARFVQRQSFIFRHDAILVAGIVFLAFALIIILMADNLAEINILGLVAFSAVPAIILGLSVYLLHRFFNPWLAKRRVTKYFESSPIMNDEKQIEFSNEGIRLTGNLSSSFVKWEAIKLLS